MKNIVYIDGQNFLYKAAEILIEKNLISDKQELTALNVRRLFETLLPGEELEIRYYGVTRIRCRQDYGESIYNKSKKFSDNLRKIRNCLAKQNVIYIPVGRLKVRDSDDCKKCGNQDYRFQEKGVDVGLAVDLVKDVYENNVDRIIIASSDTDLIPAIRLAQSKGKLAMYVGFDDRLTGAILNKANKTGVIRDAEVVEAYLDFFGKNSPKSIDEA